MTIKAVLFDFHDTLFRFESDAVWLRVAAATSGTALTDAEVAALAIRIDEARRRPEVLAAGAGRDLSPAAHRRATTGWLRLAGLPEPLVTALYERLVTPACWLPFPDAAPVLHALAGAGIAVGVLSNTGWDLRPTFQAHGMLEPVSTFILSCEVGLEKPGAEIFHRACADLGTEPGDTLMVGDNPATDGGGVPAGLPAFLLPAVRPGQPRGLPAVLRLAGVAAPIDDRSEAVSA